VDIILIDETHSARVVQRAIPYLDNGGDVGSDEKKTQFSPFL
jgi:hypothetical protein